MDKQSVLERVEQIAATTAAAAGKAPHPGAAQVVGDDDDLLRRYGFTSLDALEFLLAIEEELAIVIDDDDLSEALLSSADGLADYIVEKLGTGVAQGGEAGA